MEKLFFKNQLEIFHNGGGLHQPFRHPEDQGFSLRSGQHPVDQGCALYTRVPPSVPVVWYSP
jgi:hypothetical protein